MPYRRKKTYRRKRRIIKRKKRIYKRRIPRPMGAPSRMVRSTYIGTITASNTVATYGAFSFKLSDLPDYTEFTNLFDEYMIYSIRLFFRPNAITSVESTSYNDPWFIYAVDKDDSSAPTTYDTLMQYPGVRITSALRRHTIRFRPRFSIEIYNGVTSAYGSRVGYIDCANTAVPHYGFKYGIDKVNTANSVIYGLWATYTCYFRGLR